MYGSIIGGAAGSYLEVLEINEYRNKRRRSYEERMQVMNENYKLFDENSSCTDDSVLTVAIADAALYDRDYETKLREYGKNEIEKGNDIYGRNRFGHGFQMWTLGKTEGTSYGNGCAMRVGPIGYLFDGERMIVKESRLATIPSHNHPESIECAEIIALSIYYLRNGCSKKELQKLLEKKYNLDLSFSIERLRHENKFSSRATLTVPQAIFCFLESNDFVSCIKNTLSIGGDADTLACISGSLAEAYYGVPEYLIEEVTKYIPEYFIPIINEFYEITRVLKIK